jgi:hypothetical protein
MPFKLPKASEETGEQPQSVSSEAEEGWLPEWLRAPWRFLLEALTGFLIFVVIGAAAVGLSFLVKCLEAWKVDLLIVWGLRLAEYSLFVTDLILFWRFLWRTARRTWKEL